MKNFIFLFMTILLWLPAKAQEKHEKQSNYYVSSEFGVGNYLTYGLDLNYIIKDKFTLKLGYGGYVRNSKDKPSDLSYSISTPRDIMNTIQFMVGHTVYFNPKQKTTRINLAAGIGYTSIDKPSSWEPVITPSTSSIANANTNVPYLHNSSIEQEASFIFQPKIEFLIERYFGFTISPTLQISESETYIGIGFGSILGRIK